MWRKKIKIPAHSKYGSVIPSDYTKPRCLKEFEPNAEKEFLKILKKIKNPDVYCRNYAHQLLNALSKKAYAEIRRQYCEKTHSYMQIVTRIKGDMVVNEEHIQEVEREIDRVTEELNEYKNLYYNKVKRMENDVQD